ncbi:hypothetical protein KEM48_013216 [Puccinia striiformis f. sp. tritici PST-130]|nr:hypothetical protein KEM48_013216 [Puccinia striiformis f. sp. tritici PST-130]
MHSVGDWTGCSAGPWPDPSPSDPGCDLQYKPYPNYPYCAYKDFSTKPMKYSFGPASQVVRGGLSTCSVSTLPSKSIINVCCDNPVGLLKPRPPGQHSQSRITTTRTDLNATNLLRTDCTTSHRKHEEPQ